MNTPEVVYRVRAFDTPDDPFLDHVAAPGFRYGDDVGLVVSDDGVIVDRGPSSLEYTYRSNEGNARHSFMRWLDLDESGQADVEIVVHGREVDVDGARDLIRRVGDGMRGASGGVVG